MVGGYKNVAADGIVCSGPCVLAAVILTPAAAVGKVTVYDNTAASGSIICKLQGAADGGSVQFTPPGGVSCANGVYADVDGVGVSVSFAYR